MGDLQQQAHQQQNQQAVHRRPVMKNYISVNENDPHPRVLSNFESEYSDHVDFAQHMGKAQEEKDQHFRPLKDISSIRIDRSVLNRGSKKNSISGKGEKAGGGTGYGVLNQKNLTLSDVVSKQ